MDVYFIVFFYNNLCVVVVVLVRSRIGIYILLFVNLFENLREKKKFY